VFANPVNGVSLYNLYYSESPTVAKGNGVKVSNASPSWTIGNLTNGKTYYFTVTGETGGVESVESPVVSAMPRVPTGDTLTYGWGYSNSGELGYQGRPEATENVSQDKPTLLPNWGDIVSISGDNHLVALRRDGKVVTCGLNDWGQLGDGSQSRRAVPFVIPGLSDVKDARAGFSHSIALTNGGAVYTWGRNDTGQLGLGLTYAERGFATQPVPVPGLTSGVRAITVAGNSNLALLETGEIRAWGNNSFGQIGNGTTANALAPVTVSGITTADAIFSGCLMSGNSYSYHFARLANGTWMGWGTNGAGKLALGTDSPDSVLTPVPVPNLNGVSTLACGGEQAFALMPDGTVKSWGYNQSGQLGDGTGNARLSPKTIPGLVGVKKVVAGARFGLVLLQDGSLKTWGPMFSAYAHTGVQDDQAEFIPVTIPDLADVVDVFALSYGAVALTKRPVARPFLNVMPTVR
jgi:alpha-tubulin suppressor-like RCC1 family protein